MSAIEVRHNDQASQFEVLRDGCLAVLQYDRTDHRLILQHTAVPAPLAGQGIGSALVRAALDYARQARLLVLPRCPFAQIYLHRHPVDLPLVDPTFTWPSA